MNSGPTSERVFDTLRFRLMIRVYTPGQRLDPAVLAHDLSTSITPVRDALHLLAGRDMVDIGTGEGFHVGHIDAPALSDLYLWNLGVLTLALRSWPKMPESNDNDREDKVDVLPDPATQISAICTAIGQRSLNAEHRTAIERLNERLHPIRLAELGIMADVEGEGRGLRAALDLGELRRLQQLLAHYHRRRVRKAAEIVRLYYRR